MAHTLVLGIGNILLQDEGVGVRAAEQIQQRYEIPEGVQVLDGGTMGLDLITCLEGVEQLLVIDAVQASEPPGSIIRLVNEEIPAFLGQKISPHQIGLSDILSVARLRDMLPERMVLLGIQPASLETSLALSPTIEARLDALVDAAMHELQAWGIVLAPRA
jgi:hydrogenase maturation protease